MMVTSLCETCVRTLRHRLRDGGLGRREVVRQALKGLGLPDATIEDAGSTLQKYDGVGALTPASAPYASRPTIAVRQDSRAYTCTIRTP